MIATTDSKDKTPGAFLPDRVIRIVPMYWLAIVAEFVLVSCGVSIYRYEGDVSPLLQSLLFIPYYGSGHEIWPVIVEGWTLNYEMFFYVVFAATLMTSKTPRLIALVLTFIILVFLGSRLISADPRWLTYTSPLLLEFAAGAVLGRVYGLSLNNTSGSRAAAISFMMVGFLLAGSFLLDRLVCGAFAVVVLNLAFMIERRGFVSEVNWLRFLESASFSIYIFQQLFFDTTKRVFIHLTEMTGKNFMYIWVWRVADMLVSLIGGCILHYFVERPLERAIRRIGPRREMAIVA